MSPINKVWHWFLWFWLVQFTEHGVLWEWWECPSNWAGPCAAHLSFAMKSWIHSIRESHRLEKSSKTSKSNIWPNSGIILLWEYHFWFPQLTHYTVAKYLSNVCDHTFIELWNTLSDCSEFFRRRKNSFHEMDTTSHKVLPHSSFVCVVELGM